MSRLLFIPVPGGVQPDGTAVLRVVVVPRLDTGTVADNGLASWPPAELRDPLPVTFTPDSGPPATVDIAPRIVDQDGLWAAVFGAATVSATVHRESADPMVVTPTSQRVTALHDSYQSVARAYASAVATDPQSALAAYSAAVAEVLGRTPWAAAPIAVAPLAAPRDDPAPVPATDVNRIYGMLREHPRVLAALGLILEIEIPAASFPTGDGMVRVDWPGGAAVVPALPAVVPRATAYLGDGFLPAPDPDASDLADGLVRLDDSGWQVSAVDVESGVLRMGAAADSGPVPSIARGDGTTPAVTEGMPAQRTTGLTLVRAGREHVFAARRIRSLAVAAADDPTLYAGDLVLGYRIDVREAGETAWHPLCTRQATYRINGTVVGDEDALEEGHVKAHAAVSSSGVLRADEVVTRWDGWSLAVPRPFPVPTADGGTGAAGLPYRLDMDLTVPAGSLPPLRFGSSYELRARVADVAGGGLEVDDPPPDAHVTAAFPFLRHEPVHSPTLVLPEGAVDGELGPGVHVAQLVITSEGGIGGSVDPVTPAGMRRGLARPTASLTTSEWHGALTGDADATWPVAQLAWTGRLADPAARGIAAIVVPEPDTPASDLVRQSWPAWPDATASAIELRAVAAGSGRPVLSDDAGGFVVSLAPAQDVAVQLSSTVAAADVPRLAVSGWTLDEGVNVDVMTDPGLAAAHAGQHPMATPSTVLRCTHAVRRPLLDPSGEVAIERAAQTVPAVLTPTVALFGVDPASTGQVDITASWTEVNDAVRTDLTARPVQSLVVNRGDAAFAQPITHHLPDTRHRDVAYTVTAVSRFRDYFALGPDESFTAAPRTLRVDVPSTNRPAAPKVAGVVPAFVWEQTAGSTITRIRHGNRIRVELEAPWFDSGDDERLALVVAGSETGTRIERVTQAGRDPMYWTPSPDRLPPASAIVGSGDAAAQVVTDDGVQVDVVPAEVFLDAHAGRWFADFELPGVAGDSYQPFVRPALARYQRHSVAGCELSPVVVADFVPVLPDRTLTVTAVVDSARSSLTVTATLSGPAAEGPFANQVDIALEVGGPDTDLTAATSARTVGWFADATNNQARGLLEQPISITVEFRPPDSLSDFRLRVRELEQTAFDPDPAEPVRVPVEPLVMGTVGELGWRVIFLDIVPLAQ